MTKRIKKEIITSAILTDDGQVMIVGRNGKLTPAQDRTDWQRLKTMRDDEINYTDMPELDDAFWATAKPLPMPVVKDRVTMRVDHDVLSWLKRQGDGYQTKINAILRQYMQTHSDTAATKR